MLDSSTSTSDEQLHQLRKRFVEIRLAKRWLQEYRINAPVTQSKALAAYHNWLCQQEGRTVQMGKRIKGSF